MVKSKLTGVPSMNAVARPGDGPNTLPTDGFRPGGKQPGTKKREDAAAKVAVERDAVHYEKLSRTPDMPLSIRLWKRGIDTPDDAQRFVDALGGDMGTGAVSIKQANAYLTMLKMKIGVWFQTAAQGRTFHLMPMPPSLEGPEIDAKAERKK